MILVDDNTATVRDSFISTPTGRISGTSPSRVVITVGVDFYGGFAMLVSFKNKFGSVITRESFGGESNNSRNRKANKINMKKEQ